MVIQSSKLKRADSSDSECDDLLDEHSRSPVHGSRVDRKKRRGIIEKRRRDRINNSLTELKRLVPAAYEKQGSAKLEKAEILQMTVDHLKTVQHKGYGYQDTSSLAMDYRSIGFRECAAEVARYLVSVEGLDMHDPLRVRLLSHLQYYSHQRDAEAKTRSLCSGGGTPLPPPPPHSTTIAAATQQHNPWAPVAAPPTVYNPQSSTPTGFHATSSTSPAESLFSSAGQHGSLGNPYSNMVAPCVSTAAAGDNVTTGGSGGGGFLSSGFRLTSAGTNPSTNSGLSHPSMPCSGLLPSHAFSSIGIGSPPGGMTTSGYPSHPHQTGSATSLLQSSHHMGMKPYRPWGTELGAY